MLRRISPLVMLAVLTTTLVAAAARDAAARSHAGGIFRVSIPHLDFIDPALSYSPPGWALLDTTCARLMSYADKPLPEGFRLIPEVATGPPTVSRDGKRFTFTVRQSFRFSDGTPVTASAFAHAIKRTLAPGVESPGSQYTGHIVGAEDFRTGKTQRLTGVVAQGNRLVVRFTRPVPDFAAQTTMPFFCAVPPTLPPDPEGVGAIPGSGPYYVSEYRPGQRVLIRRNRFYRGDRPHRVDGFDVDLQARSDAEVLDRVEGGTSDYGLAGGPPHLDPARRLAAKYGRNELQFFITPGLTLRGFAFNTSRPLFRDNAKLRQAVNLAVDRRAFRRIVGGPLANYITDQYLPPTMPGFTNVALFPQRPNLQKARALAHDNTRSRKAVLYTFDNPVSVAQAQILRANLAAIDLEVQITALPPQALARRLQDPDEAWDIGVFGWAPDYIDPYAYINILLEGRFIGATNFSRLDSPRYNRLMRRAAALDGRARYRAYGKLDVQLARDVSPLIPMAFSNEFTLVSKRVGCVVLRPTLDLTAVCLK